MSTFVLVHGSWHGAWCWERIIPMLEKAGHRAIAIDLPAHGTDHTPLAEVNLKSYTDRLSAVLEKESEKVILLGHSMAGVVISQIAEYFPEKSKSLCICARFFQKTVSRCSMRSVKLTWAMTLLLRFTSMKLKPTSVLETKQSNRISMPIVPKRTFSLLKQG